VDDVVGFDGTGSLCQRRATTLRPGDRVSCAVIAVRRLPPGCQRLVSALDTVTKSVQRIGRGWHGSAGCVRIVVAVRVADADRAVVAG
jgi:hypothetical protein